MKFRAAALFDFDLTLMDTSHIITECTNLLTDHFGLRRVSRDEMLRLIGLPIMDSWAALWGEAREEWLTYYRANLRAMEHADFREFPDTRSAITRLRENGVATGIVTNRNNARAAAEACGIAEMFDVVVGAEDVSHPKPHPEPVLKGMSLLGTDASLSFYTGDTDIDMKTAAAAGVRGIGVTTGNFGAGALISAGGTFACPNLSEVADTILREIKTIGR
jgi:HAD superfamily hydrolase (TIGR01549 family)